MTRRSASATAHCNGYTHSLRAGSRCSGGRGRGAANDEVQEVDHAHRHARLGRSLEKRKWDVG